MIRKTLPFLLALVFLFSGCLGIFDDDLEAENGEEAETSPEGTTTENDNGDSGSNMTAVAITASVEANITEGFAPLDVTFTLTGNHSHGGPLTWSLNTGDDEDAESGDELPTNVTLTFDTAGNHTIVLNVTDGDNSEQANVTITVLPEDVPDPIVLEGEVTVPHLAFFTTGSESCVSFLTGVSGIDCELFEIEEEWIGRPFTGTADGGDIDLEFRSSCDVTSESVQMFGNDGHEEGTIPEGAGCVVIANWVDFGPLTFTIF